MFGADESSETLFEFEDGFGELIVEEGVPTIHSDLFEAGLEQRLIGYGEWQLGDYEVREGFTGYVDALPETIGSQQDAVLVASKFVEQPGAIQRFTLFQ